jgi:hypothetical protein
LTLFRVVICCTLLFVAGCSAGALHIASLNVASIDPPPAEVMQFDARRCAWWIDGNGDMNISMVFCKRNLLLGKLGSIDIFVSFALDKPPAGSGRDYPIRQRESRVMVKSAATNMRFVGHSGIISVIRAPGNRFKGSFRILMNTIAEVPLLSFLPQRPGPVVCFGTFEAQFDPQIGEVLLKVSEQDGWARQPQIPPPTTSAAAGYRTP